MTAKLSSSNAEPLTITLIDEQGEAQTAVLSDSMSETFPLDSGRYQLSVSQLPEGLTCQFNTGDVSEQSAVAVAIECDESAIQTKSVQIDLGDQVNTADLAGLQVTMQAIVDSELSLTAPMLEVALSEGESIETGKGVISLPAEVVDLFVDDLETSYQALEIDLNVGSAEPAITDF